MRNYPMTELIAAREYALEMEGKRLPIYVEIGKPARVPDMPEHDPQSPTLGHWYCPFIIRGGRDMGVLSGGGVDSLHALTHSLVALDTILKGEAKKGKLTFLGDEGTFIPIA